MFLIPWEEPKAISKKERYPVNCTLMSAIPKKIYYFCCHQQLEHSINSKIYSSHLLVAFFIYKRPTKPLYIQVHLTKAITPPENVLAG